MEREREVLSVSTWIEVIHSQKGWAAYGKRDQAVAFFYFYMRLYYTNAICSHKLIC